MLTVTVGLTRRSERRLVKPGADNRTIGTEANASRGGGAEKMDRSRERTPASLRCPGAEIVSLVRDYAELESDDRPVGQVLIVGRHVNPLDVDGPRRC